MAANARPRATLGVCETCAPVDLGPMRRALEDAGLGHRVRVTALPCMNACGNPVSMSLQGPGLATCLFSGVAPDDDLADIVITVQLWLDSPAGWIGDARPCGRLRHLLIGRVAVPPLEEE